MAVAMAVAMSDFHVTITGAAELAQALRQYKAQSAQYMAAAGNEVGAEIIDSPGLSQYPPSGPANEPPVPYYIRGVGTQTASGNRDNSERYGTQFTTEPDAYGVTIGNRASYAKYLASDDYQAAAMAAIGWAKLSDVAQSKLDKIAEIYQGWVDKLIQDIGL